MRRFGLLLLSGLLAAGCEPPAEQAPPEDDTAADTTAAAPVEAPAEAPADAGPVPERAAFFGDLHVHTRTRTTPSSSARGPTRTTRTSSPRAIPSTTRPDSPCSSTRRWTFTA